MDLILSCDAIGRIWKGAEGQQPITAQKHAHHLRANLRGPFPGHLSPPKTCTRAQHSGPNNVLREGAREKGKGACRWPSIC